MTELDRELVRDIGYALSQSSFKVKGQRIESLRLVAQGIVEHLRCAGWLFELKPPTQLHGPTAMDPEAGGDAFISTSSRGSAGSTG